MRPLFWILSSSLAIPSSVVCLMYGSTVRSANQLLTEALRKGLREALSEALRAHNEHGTWCDIIYSFVVVVGLAPCILKEDRGTLFGALETGEVPVSVFALPRVAAAAHLYYRLTCTCHRNHGLQLHMHPSCFAPHADRCSWWNNNPS